MQRRLLNLSQYAEHRAARGLAGGTHTAVQRALQSGRITGIPDEKGRTRIDPEVADIQWAAKTDPIKSAATNGDKPLAAPPDSGRSGSSLGDRAENSGSEYWQAKTRREIAEAARAEIEMRKAAGDLVSRKAIEDTARRCARVVRDAVMLIPERMAPQLGLTAEQERVLSDALRTAVTDAAKTADSALRSALPEMHET